MQNNRSKSIILQVDESTRLMMDEIKNRISEDIVDNLTNLEQEVESASSILKSINEESQKLKEIHRALHELKTDSSRKSNDNYALASDFVAFETDVKTKIEELPQVVFSFISEQVDSIQNTIGLIPTIKGIVESASNPEQLAGIQNQMGFIHKTLDSFSTNAAQSLRDVSAKLTSVVQSFLPGIRQQNEGLQKSIDDSKTIIESIKKTVDSDTSPELLTQIRGQVEAVEKSLDIFTASAAQSLGGVSTELTSVAQSILPGIRQQNEDLQKSIDDSKTIIESIKKTVDSDMSPELLTQIRGQVEAVEKSLDIFTASAAQSLGGVSTELTSVAQSILPGIRQQNEGLQKSIDDSKTIIESIKKTVDSDTSPELLTQIRGQVEIVEKALDAFSGSTADSIIKLSEGNQKQVEDLQLVLERIQLLESSFGTINTLLMAIDDREKKMDGKISSIVESNKESRTIQMRILYNTTPFWRRKLRQQLKRLL